VAAPAADPNASLEELAAFESAHGSTVGEDVAEPPVPAAAPAADPNAPLEELAPVESVPGQADEAAAGASDAAACQSDVLSDESVRIEDAGSPTHIQADEAGPEDRREH
jgi:hypothetical protein